jgi:alanine dehydrogenase
MILGVPRDRVPTENRVALTPAGVRALVHRGHTVLIESGAGRAARFTDEEYAEAGGRLVYGADEVLGRADLVMKVSALAPGEVPRLREGQAILAFHHLAATPRSQLDALLRRGVSLIGLEILEDDQGDAPVLHSMSEIGGQLAVGVAAHQLQTLSGGRGILLGGAIGIPPARVVILGAGVSGVAAARRAVGNGAQVTLLDTSLAALRRADEIFERGIVTEVSHLASVSRAIACADVVIGAVLVRGERAPQIVSRGMVRGMKPGAVIIDLSIDQGGCVETSRPTTLADPVFVEHEVVHCAVPNLSSAVARTASLALTYAALPFVETLAERGLEATLTRQPGFARGLYLYRGELVCPSVGRAFGMRATPLSEILGARPRVGLSPAGGRRL